MGYFNERPDYVAATGLAINQGGHTFVVGDQIYFDGSNWQLAQANSETTLRTAMVSQVPRNDWFVAITDGQVDWPAHGLTPGALYYLSSTVAGGYTTARPVATGEFVQGVFTVVDANTVTVLEMPATTAEGGSGTNATVPIIAGGGGGGLRSLTVTNLPINNTGWYRIGTIAPWQIVEIDLFTFRTGIGAGSMRFVVGVGGNNGNLDISKQIKVAAQGGLVQIEAARIAFDAGALHFEVRGAATTGTQYDMTATVVGESTPNSFQFDPTFNQYNAGTQACFFNELDNNRIQSGLAYGGGLTTIQRLTNTTLDVGKRTISQVGQATANGEALRWENQPRYYNPVFADGGVLPNNVTTTIWQFTPPAEWAGRIYRVDISANLDALGTAFAQYHCDVSLTGSAGGGTKSVTVPFFPSSNGRVNICTMFTGTFANPMTQMSVQLTLRGISGNFRNVAALASGMTVTALYF